MIKSSDSRIENLEAILELISAQAESIISACDAMNDPCGLLEEASDYILRNAPDLSSIKSRTAFRIEQTNQGIKRSSQTLSSSVSMDELLGLQKMFPKVPSELITIDVDKKELRRLSCAYELLQTEIDYVNDLSTIIHHHKGQFDDYDGVRSEDVKTVFSNIQDILAVNKTLLSRLLARKDIDTSLRNISSAINDSVDSFKIYSIYCANYPRAIKRLAHFKGFLSVIYYD